MKRTKLVLMLLIGFILVGCNQVSQKGNNISFEKLKQKFLEANFEVTEGTLYADMVNSIYVVYGESENNSLVAEYKTVETAKKECDSNNEAGYSVCARNGKFIILYDKNENPITLQTFNSAF